MPKVTVYYFPLKALGEGIRLLLAYGGEEFEDRRVTKEEWPAIKPTMPFGQMPVLEVDGKKYAQSLAIVRYLGRKHGLGGKNIEEDFEIDQNIEFWNDIRIKAASVSYEQDEKVKAAKQADLEKNFYPVALKKLDDIIAKNNGHMALGKLTWADFLFAGMYDCLKKLLQMPDLDEKYPRFKKLEQTVYTIPKVKAYADKAPKCDYYRKMPKVIVYYFPLKAVGEPIRLLLAYGGEEFEDRRVTQDEWPSVKPTMPFGQMPVMEVDGKKYAQSIPIVRYLGRKHGLGGGNIEEDFEIDQNVEFWNDIRSKGAAVFHEEDEKAAARMQADLEKNYYPAALKKLDEIIAKNNGYMALGKLTWADFLFAGMYECIKKILHMPDLDEKYPRFKQLEQTVYAIPKVKAFSDKAPKSEF
ncbi:uncharacterized protein LOC123873935 [Maniola jurtina]|uniref:uncharacterized protein LOC123873935 n=1 Tax=Maniola jurtina TaxID=191418 RepID=UPI001E68ECE5|nr:uncharacterized protein LOC123873935 [Maniola jurtina]